MKSHRKVSLAVAAAVCCIVVFWLSTSTGQNRRSYQVETQVYTTPEYRTDAARAIDAYERVMERYMDATERNFTAVLSYTGSIAAKLDAIDAKLARLDERLARIENHLGIVPPAPAADPNGPKPLVPVPPVPGVRPMQGGRQ